jgi:hypothetical protein
MYFERPPKNDPGGSRIRDMRIKRANAHYMSSIAERNEVTSLGDPPISYRGTGAWYSIAAPGPDLKPVGAPHLLFKGNFLQALAGLGTPHLPRWHASAASCLNTDPSRIPHAR